MLFVLLVVKIVVKTVKKILESSKK
ncbi:D-fructose-6-phosphate amidotransferase [Marinobacter sp. ELB17]|nr:D-fructose-6-phosphate amidotransferase [Marinobacter sp. ELB17]